jgi:hypothetical protein
MSIKRDELAMDESEMGFTMDELREFLEGDLVDVKADPEFKERLRGQLWQMLRRRVLRGRAGGDPGF